MGNNVGKYFQGAGHGALSLIGQGKHYDPLGDKRSELSAARTNMQTTINSYSAAVLAGQIKTDSDIAKEMETQRETIEEQMKAYNDLISDDIVKENLFISIIAALVGVLIFFMLIK